MNYLLIVTPSRGRPGRLQVMADSVHAHKRGDVRIVACVDDDDPALPAYRRVTGVDLRVGPRQGLVGWSNTIAVEAVHAADPPAYLASLGDDHVVHTPGFDRRLAAALDALAPAGLAFGNDMHRGEHLPTAVAMTAGIVAALGYMAPPQLDHLYCDRWWLTLGRRLRRITYLPGVVIEHRHHRTGRAPKDAGYRRVNSRRQYARDRAAFDRYVNAGHLRRDVRLLKELCPPEVTMPGLAGLIDDLRLPRRGIVHVGGHLGEEIPSYRRHGFDPIVVVEANPDLAARITAAHPDVTVHACAAAAANGTATLHVTERTKLSSLHRPLRHPVTDQLTVPVRRLAALIDERVNVAVIDVQGAELDVMAGAPDWLDLVVLEARTKPKYEGAPLRAAVEAWMARHGWTAVAQWPHNDRLTDIAFAKKKEQQG